MALPPLDHRIPMANMPADVPVQTPQDWQRASLERQAAEQTTRANALKLREMERASAEQDALRQIAAESGGDWDVMIERASRLNPALAATLTEQRAKTQTAVAEAYTKQIAAEKQRTERGIAFLRVAASDPELYQQMRPTLAPLLPEELQAALPEQHDPERIAFLYEAALDAKTAMDRADKLHERIQSGDALKGVLGLLAEQDTQEEYEGVLQAYASYLPKGAMAMIPKWSPDAPAKAAQLAMTPDQRVDNKRADAETALSAARLDLARQAEARQARQGDARLGLESARLGLARQQESRMASQAAREAQQQASGVVKLPAAVATTVAGVEQSLSVLDKMEDTVPTSMLGPVAGRWTQWSASMPGVPVPAPVAKYLAEEATLKNSVIKATTGAAMSEAEAQRIMSQIPLITDKPEVWRQKAKATRENLTFLRRRTLELSGVSEGMPTQAVEDVPETPMGGTGAATHRWNPQTRRLERVP